jgi:hypothetical protein
MAAAAERVERAGASRSWCVHRFLQLQRRLWWALAEPALPQ